MVDNVVDYVYDFRIHQMGHPISQVIIRCPKIMVVMKLRHPNTQNIYKILLDLDSYVIFQPQK